MLFLVQIFYLSSLYFAKKVLHICERCASYKDIKTYNCTTEKNDRGFYTHENTE